MDLTDAHLQQLARIQTPTQRKAILDIAKKTAIHPPDHEMTMADVQAYFKDLRNTVDQLTTGERKETDMKKKMSIKKSMPKKLSMPKKGK